MPWENLKAEVEAEFENLHDWSVHDKEAFEEIVRHDQREKRRIACARKAPATNARRRALPKKGHQNSRKKACPQGHAYAGENLLVSSGRRRCRACDNARRRIRD